MIEAPYKYLDSSQVSELLAYLPTSIVYSQWIDHTLTLEQKEASLNVATVIFDSLPWKGYKMWEYQVHAFPRRFSSDVAIASRTYRDALGSGRSEVSDLPYSVAMGLAIIASNVANNKLNNFEDEDEWLTSGISSASIGSISVSISNQHGQDMAKIPRDAVDWIQPYCFLSSSGKGVSTFRLL